MLRSSGPREGRPSLGRGLVHEVDGFVRQEAVSDVAVAQHSSSHLKSNALAARLDLSGLHRLARSKWLISNSAKVCWVAWTSRQPWWWWWLGWVGLGWVGLGWVGLGWVGLGWVGLGWVGLGWVGLGWVGWGGVGWGGVGWGGVGWGGVGWGGVGWGGVGWGGLGLVRAYQSYF